MFSLAISERHVTPRARMMGEAPNGSISIVQLFQDAEYAWDRLQTRKDNYGPVKTGFHFNTRVSSNYNYTLMTSMGLLPSYYAMYKITNDTKFLDSAWSMFEKIIQYSTRTLISGNRSGRVLFNYHWITDTLDEPNIVPITFFAPIALEDPRYIPYFEEFFAANHELFTSPINLLYSSIDSRNGQVTSNDFHLTFINRGHEKLSQNLWMYELTGNSTYKQWADEFIEGIWALRSPATNLLPRQVNAETGAVLKGGSITHYDMTGWLSGLELAYYLNDQSKTAGTGNNTYFDLINKTATAIATYMWHSTAQRWVYKCSYSSGSCEGGSIPEMNSIWVDYTMIRASEITGQTSFLQKAIADFDTGFMGSDPTNPNGTLMSRSLVIHSPNTYSTQSQFTGSSNLMVARTAYLVYLHTQDRKYLDKAYVHYQQLMSTHRFSKGYTNLLDTETMKPYPSYNGNPAIIYDRAPVEAILALQNALLPSPEVSIDWGYGLSSSLPNDYGTPGAFTGVSVDINQKRVGLESVNASAGGSILFNFSRDGIITNALMDGQDYTLYLDNTLYPATGIHSYLISFNSTIPPPISWTRTSSSSTSSSTSSDHSSSSSITSSTITNTSEFTMQPFIGGLILAFIIHRRLRRKSS